MVPPGIDGLPLFAEEVLISKVAALLLVVLAVITAFTFTLCAAVNVSLFALQLTASLMLMLPAPFVLDPWLERMLTLPPLSAVERVAPEISPLGVPLVTVPSPLEATVKSVGSIVQVPDLP